MVVVRAGLLGCVLLALAAGCVSESVPRVPKNPKAWERVMTAIASDGALAEQMTQRLLATDSLRTRVVETMLLDSKSAQYVLARIGTNPAAMDYVIQAAWSDSISRAHLVARMETIRKAVSTGR